MGETLTRRSPNKCSPSSYLSCLAVALCALWFNACGVTTNPRVLLRAGCPLYRKVLGWFLVVIPRCGRYSIFCTYIRTASQAHRRTRRHVRTYICKFSKRLAPHITRQADAGRIRRRSIRYLPLPSVSRTTRQRKQQKTQTYRVHSPIYPQSRSRTATHSMHREWSCSALDHVVKRLRHKRPAKMTRD